MKKRSILIVDDEVRMRESMAMLLGDDFHVFTAENGEEALPIFYKTPLSLILLDLDMPVMNGVETLKRIREKCLKTKVLIMTGRSRHHWAMECADLNVQGYVEKPFDLPALIGRLKGLVGSNEYPVLKKEWGPAYDAKMSMTSPLFREAIRFIAQKLGTDMTRDDIAAHLGITSEYLSRFFRKASGVGLRDYINRCRIEESLECMEKAPHITVARVAESVGIPDVNYFGRLFKKRTGLSPGEYRNKHQSSTPQ